MSKTSTIYILILKQSILYTVPGESLNTPIYTFFGNSSFLFFADSKFLDTDRKAIQLAFSWCQKIENRYTHSLKIIKCVFMGCI